jgi:hypothetical protein
VGISRDYPLKTRTSKQPTGEIPGYELIPSHPLKYPRSKQGLKIVVLLAINVEKLSREIAFNFGNEFLLSGKFILSEHGL